MQLHALSKELEMEPTKASRLLTALGYGNSFPSELDGDMELHLRTVTDMLNRGFTINDAVGVVKRQIDGLDADDPDEPSQPPVKITRKRGRPKGAKNKKSWADICWESQLKRWEDPDYPIDKKISYLEHLLVRDRHQEELLQTLKRLKEKEAVYAKPIPIRKHMDKKVAETEDTKERLKQLLLDICLNLVSQRDASDFEANKERCLSLLRRNNAGQPLTVN